MEKINVGGCLRGGVCINRQGDLLGGAGAPPRAFARKSAANSAPVSTIFALKFKNQK